MAVEQSYVYQILRFLADVRRPCSVDEIFYMIDSWRLEGGYRIAPKSPASVQAALVRLAEIGVIRSNDEQMFWSLTAPHAEPEAPTDQGRRGDGNGNDGGGRNPVGGPDGQDGGGGGAGLSEVLSHPVLFCMAEAEQANLIEAALGLLPEGAQA